MSARLVSDHWTVWVGPGPCPRTGHRLTAQALGNPWQDDGPAGLRRYVYELTASEPQRRNVVALLSGQRVGASCPALGSLLVDVANGVPMHQAEARALEQLGVTLDLFAGGDA